MPASDRGQAQLRLNRDPDKHIEDAIGSLREAVHRVVRGIEVLDLEIISSAKEKLDEAERSVLEAIKLRRRSTPFADMIPSDTAESL